jgi:hypothetical protein
VVLLGALLLSCSNDEENLRPPPPSASIINVAFDNAKVIDVDSDRHLALLLHSGQAEPGTVLQLVDLAARSVLASNILVDYFELYDVKFINDTLACFAGRPHGHIGFAVQFVSLPSLILSTRVMVTSDTSGNAGFLAVDSTGSFVYYSHAGGGIHDGVYKIRVSNRTLVDADNDGQAPFAFDNDLVSGLFDGPAKIFYDEVTGKIVVANPSFMTIISSTLWGTLNRADNLSFPVSGTSHLSTQAGANADMMAYGDGVYVFSGGAVNQPTLSRFGVNSIALDLTELLPHVSWWRSNPAIAIHPREDVVSTFVLYEDSAGVAVGQYRLNNLVEVAASPYRTRTIPDTSISTFGLDVVSNRLIIADKDHPRLELISIE